MAATFSTEVLQVMGLRPFNEGETVSASFWSIFVFEARGITLQVGSVQVASGIIADVNYRVAAGAKLNETSLALCNDVFAESEEEWAKEKKCSGPYLLLQFGPTRTYCISDGQIKHEDDGSLTTYQSFPDLRSDLALLESNALAPVLTSLSCQLGEPGRIVEFVKLDRTSVGQTTSGQWIHDRRFEFSSRAYVSQSLSSADLAANLQAAADLAKRLNVKAARHYALGLGEEDELKKFLYFFLALEIQTHAVFGRVDHAKYLSASIGSGWQPASTAAQLLQRQTKQLRGLFDRFVWCAATTWTTIDESDISIFKSLKEVRDNIAHGSISEPPAGNSGLAQRLARKVLRA